MSGEDSALNVVGSRTISGDRQRLNAMDRALNAIDSELRSSGQTGFQTQMIVCLSGGIDVSRLQTSLDRVSKLFPVITAHLVDAPTVGDPHWQFRPEAECTLHHTQLETDHPEALFNATAQLLTEPNDLSESDPVRFHLLHRPDGHDVFMMQYNHSLMDNAASVNLLNEIARGCEAEVDLDVEPIFESGDPLADHLHRYPRRRRYTAMLKVLHRRWRLLRGRARMLSAAGSVPTAPATQRMATRVMDAKTTADVNQRVMKVCGFPSLSMAILASVFRTLDDMARARNLPEGRLVAGIGIELGLQRFAESPLQNLSSVLPVHAESVDLDSRDGLTRMLTQQVRDRLECDHDVGVLQLATLFQNQPRFVRRNMRRLFRDGYSLWYAYFGTLEPVEQLCGAKVEKVQYAVSSWSPVGFSLVVNQWRGQLYFQLTHVPELISENLASEFLDAVVSDLIA